MDKLANAKEMMERAEEVYNAAKLYYEYLLITAAESSGFSSGGSYARRKDHPGTGGRIKQVRVNYGRVMLEVEGYNNPIPIEEAVRVRKLGVGYEDLPTES